MNIFCSSRRRIFRAAICFLLMFSVAFPLIRVRADEVSVAWSEETLPEGELSAEVSGARDGDVVLLAVYDCGGLESCLTETVSNGCAAVSAYVGADAYCAKIFVCGADDLSLDGEPVSTLLPSVVYRGFAGRYQHIFVNGQKIREKDGKIIADENDQSDMSDQFLPRDMGDGSYAFEPRSSNQSYKERQLYQYWDDYENDWAYEYREMDAWNGFTRRIAAAAEGEPLPSAKYQFANKTLEANPLYEGMNDDTQHWIREKSEDYTEREPSYYLRSLQNDLYMVSPPTVR